MKYWPDIVYMFYLQICSDNSSLSSFTSDLEAAPNPTSDDQHAKIRYLIKNFDTLPSRLNRTDEFQSSSSGEKRGNNLSSSMKLPSGIALTINPYQSVGICNDCVLL